MWSWLSEIASSHKLQLAVVAVVSGSAAASAVIGLQNAKRWYSVHELKDSIPDPDEDHEIRRVCLYFLSARNSTDEDQR